MTDRKCLHRVDGLVCIRKAGHRPQAEHNLIIDSRRSYEKYPKQFQINDKHAALLTDARKRQLMAAHRITGNVFIELVWKQIARDLEFDWRSVRPGPTNRTFWAIPMRPKKTLVEEHRVRKPLRGLSL